MINSASAIDNINFEWVGSFKFPTKREVLGESRFAFTAGVIALNEKGDSLFVTGHKQFGGIAEIKIPPLVKSQEIKKLNVASMVQPFVKFLRKKHLYNPQKLDTITGMRVIDGKLVVNAIEYYDADANNTQTTFVISNASNLKNSTISPFKELEGAARASGWITPLPQKWQYILNSKYLVGHASNYPIFSRLSIGPSLFLFNKNDLNQSVIPTRELLGFSLKNPLEKDIYNVREKTTWTANSRAVFGFILPDLPIYYTLGTSAGNKYGVGYKLKRSAGKSCPGQCPIDPTDIYNYYWTWSLNELFKVDMGEKKSFNIRPSMHGSMEFIDEHPSILGADFDYKNNLLYILLGGLDKESLNYEPLPIVKVFKYLGAKSD